jgi:hypothetical protein
MMHTLRRRWAGLALVAMWALAACTGDPATVEEGPPSGPGANDGLAGAYQMKMYRGHPVPYFDFRTQEQVRSSTLNLDGAGAFVEVINNGIYIDSLQGTYTRAADSVVLREASGGGERVLNHQSGVLRGGTAPAEVAYVRQGDTVPAEYRLRGFSLRSCGGHTPTALEPCRGPGYYTYSGSLWLSDAGRFYRSETGVGATVRSSGTYNMVSLDSLVFSSAEYGWSTHGVLRADTLTTGTFVYVALGR